jgi:adenosylcobyric acid synthase
MNPILLKPTNDVGSQIIVNGEVRGQMNARDYFAMKHELLPDVMKPYNTLSEQNDIIVIEGAGSPAEINLKEDDPFVNMGMAREAKAPVLIVGDIDRGGVFAQLYGTVALLPEEERSMVKGLIINKFRGDESILTPGVKQIEELTGIPVVGGGALRASGYRRRRQPFGEADGQGCGPHRYSRNEDSQAFQFHRLQSAGEHRRCVLKIR